MTSRIVKVAAVQAAPVSFDLEKSLSKLLDLTSEASQAGADLVVFPSEIVPFTCYRTLADSKLERDFSQLTRGAMHLTSQSVLVSLVVSHICQKYVPPLTLTLSGRKWFAKYYNSAIAIASPEFDRLRSIARECKVFLSVGIIEKEGGTLYCSAVLIDREGVLLYNHRKVIKTPAHL
jgi:predicted amidohydrolase